MAAQWETKRSLYDVENHMAVMSGILIKEDRYSSLVKTCPLHTILALKTQVFNIITILNPAELR